MAALWRGVPTAGQVSFFMVNKNGEAYEFNYVGHALDPHAAPVAPVKKYLGVDHMEWQHAAESELGLHDGRRQAFGYER